MTVKFYKGPLTCVTTKAGGIYCKPTKRSKTRKGRKGRKRVARKRLQTNGPAPRKRKGRKGRRGRKRTAK
jgi:hypothetical protein